MTVITLDPPGGGVYLQKVPASGLDGSSSLGLLGVGSLGAARLGRLCGFGSRLLQLPGGCENVTGLCQGQEGHLLERVGSKCGSKAHRRTGLD
jgi:hypothetical protein